MDNFIREIIEKEQLVFAKGVLSGMMIVVLALVYFGVVRLIV